MSLIKLGRVPQAPSDQWFIFFENNTLFIHDAESGQGVFQATFRPLAGGGHLVSEAIVNGNVTRYERRSNELEAARLQRLIAVTLANRSHWTTDRSATSPETKDRVHAVLQLRRRSGAKIQVAGPLLRIFDRDNQAIDEIDLAALGNLHFSRMHMVTNQNCNYFAGKVGRTSPVAFSVVRFGRFGKTLEANDWVRSGAIPEIRATYSFIGD